MAGEGKLDFATRMGAAAKEWTIDEGTVPFSDIAIGSGAGSAVGWHGVTRHHHPTRLSDDLDGDERSRQGPLSLKDARSIKSDERETRSLPPDQDVVDGLLAKWTTVLGEEALDENSADQNAVEE